jgi:hypothetical protein
MNFELLSILIQNRRRVTGIFNLEEFLEAVKEIPTTTPAN